MKRSKQCRLNVRPDNCGTAGGSPTPKLSVRSSSSATGSGTEFPSAWRRWNWFFGLLLVAATLIAYQPAWNGKPIWDDDGHFTKPELRSLEGLTRIWTQPGAAQQYYPLVHTVFWVEHRLWGDSTLGYHLVNILLHAGSALLVWAILRRLAVPGA